MLKTMDSSASEKSKKFWKIKQILKQRQIDILRKVKKNSIIRLSLDYLDDFFYWFFNSIVTYESNHFESKPLAQTSYIYIENTMERKLCVEYKVVLHI